MTSRASVARGLDVAPALRPILTFAAAVSAATSLTAAESVLSR